MAFSRPYRRFLVFLLALLVTVGCRGGDRAQTSKSQVARTVPAKKSAGRTASVTTPPLEMATTSEATGVTLPAVPTAPAGTQEPVAYAPTEVKAHTNIILLFDASGSMTGPVESDTKIAYLKRVLKDLIVQPAPGGMQRSIGLRTFGSQFPLDQQQCEDSLELARVGKLDPEKLGPAIDALTPRGTSPIAFALQQAAAALPAGTADTDNMIILIADGGDTCNADPCLAARQIHEASTKAMVHVIGFDLDQDAEKQLRCVAEASDGRFFLARNVPELRSAADQALNANLPYNLRIKSFAGTTPLPTNVTIYRSGTRHVVDQGQSTGIKFLQLQPGSYDILIAYEESVQQPKPSKLLKGVEVQSSARAEQVVYFDLGTVALSGVAPSGDAVALQYAIGNQGEAKPFATVEGRVTPLKVILTPGTYTITARGPTVHDIPLLATLPRLALQSGEVREQAFRFETGELTLTAKTSQQVAIPVTYQIHSAATADPQTPVASGEVPAEGKTIALPVGLYTFSIEPRAAGLRGYLPVVLENVEIAARKTLTQEAVFPVGLLTLIGKEGDGRTSKTEFQIRRAGAENADAEILQQEVTEAALATVTLAPGLYQVTAVRLEGELTPPPSLVWESVEVTADQTVAKEAIFQLGTLRLASKDAKDQPLKAEFSIFRPGNATPLVVKRTTGDPVDVRLTPGFYDVQAQDVSSSSTIKPTIWLHEVPVTANADSDQVVTFTSGRVRITCRGANEASVPCHFRIFTYGQDAPLYAGETADNWKEFEMAPGYYYIEVGYDDTVHDYELKKWLNLAVAENQTVEQVVRF